MAGALVTLAWASFFFVGSVLADVLGGFGSPWDDYASGPVKAIAISAAVGCLILPLTELGDWRLLLLGFVAHVAASIWMCLTYVDSEMTAFAVAMVAFTPLFMHIPWMLVSQRIERAIKGRGAAA